MALLLLVTPLEFNKGPEKCWLEDQISSWEGNFLGAMLNFGGVIHGTTHPEVSQRVDF